ncbi:Nucleotide-diphospho-sugar transferase family protein [Salix suchowensis]|nr:Nucleotide-diphospho-sugar transferase family protein [Salix suchowensis]
MNTAPLFRPQTTTRRKLPVPTRLLRTRFNPSFPASTSMFSESTFPRAVLVLVAISISALILYGAADSLRFNSSSSGYPFNIFPSHRYSNNSGSSNSDPKLSINDDDGGGVGGDDYKLEKVLKEAAMEDKTVIIATLNEAWAAPNTIIDLFLESFRTGQGTRRLLNHLVIVALDRKAYRRCMEFHAHCFALVTEGLDFHDEAYFMTPAYLEMMWRRIDLLRSVLQMGYNFVFTDADIMWFRDPFPRFYLDADFQIACDHFLGNSSDVQNRPNGGFNYVKSNNRTIEFYKFWYSSRETYPGYHDQDVLNFIKFDPFIEDLGLKMRFLDTAFFGGLCEPSKDLNLVCTMHANCCYGLESKLHDLRIMLQDWKFFLSLPPTLKRSSSMLWRVPQNCSLNSLRRYDSPEKSDQQSLQH